MERMQYWLLVGIGIVVLLVSVFAHQLGVGNSGFGTKKLVGTIAGVAIVLLGLWLVMRTSRVGVP